MTIESWLQAALADAERRGLTDLKPLLEALARATAALRTAEFSQSARLRSTENPSSSGEARHSADGATAADKGRQA